MQIPNNKRIIAKRSLLVMLVGLLMIFVPMNLGLDGMDGGFALAVFGGLIAITALITYFIYMRLAREQDNLMNGTNLLAHWKYNTEQWRAYAEIDYQEDKAAKKMLFWLVAGFALFFGIIFAVFGDDGGIYVLYVMLALIALIAVVAKVSAQVTYKRNLSRTGEVLLSEHSALINGQLHVWNLLNARLIDVRLVEYEQMNMLEIEYVVPQRNADAQYTARIPIPYGKEAEAEAVAQEIRKHKKN